MKISQCGFCGDDLGEEIEKRHGEHITCGKRECERWASHSDEIERAEAHEQLDRDRGWL